MKTPLLLALALAFLVGCATPSGRAPAYAVAPDAAPLAAWQANDTSVPEDRGLGHQLLWYIPNRISDLLDIVRLRLRVGPGFQIGARITEAVDLNVGGYTSIFIGIPGPRQAREFNWPFGFESLSGMEFMFWDGTASPGDGPNYGLTEIGLGLQVVLVGLDLGVDVWEALDFVTGLVCVDPGEDDI
jgi:hypothetical protein